MPRTPRKQSESGFYHLYSRGSGRQIIYEDNDDRMKFLRCLAKALESSETTLYAYCLMGNHYHIVIRSSFEGLSSFAHDLNCPYANYFNNRHERTGHLFEGRFCSQPVTGDEHFLTAIRYVHRNPVEAGIVPTCDYDWSSYGAYVNPEQSASIIPVDTDLALNLSGSRIAFEEFHAHSGKEAFADDRPDFRSLSEPELLSIARDALNGFEPSKLKTLSKPTRARGLGLLRTTGLTVAQIALVTGLSRSTIRRGSPVPGTNASRHPDPRVP